MVGYTRHVDKIYYAKVKQNKNRANDSAITHLKCVLNENTHTHTHRRRKQTNGIFRRKSIPDLVCCARSFPFEISLFSCLRHTNERGRERKRKMNFNMKSPQKFFNLAINFSTFSGKCLKIKRIAEKCTQNSAFILAFQAFISNGIFPFTSKCQW